MRACLGLVLVIVLGCVDKGPGDQGQRIDPSDIQANLLSEPPATLGQRVDAGFGDGKITYLGNDVATTRVAPGDKVTVTHYWQVVEPPGPGWRVFSHLRGGTGADFANVDLTDMRTGHPPDRWKAGQIIRDEQTFVLRKDWKSATALLVVGLYQQGKHRIADRMAVSAAAEADPRVRDDRSLTVLQLQVDLSRAPPPPGTLLVKKAIGPVVIDGKADEPAWGGAAVQTSFTGAEGCELGDPTEARLTWDDQFLYLFVSSEDADIFSPFTQQDDHLWEHDVVEIFIDADGNRRGYVELQVNPRNTHFDTWFVAGRPNRDDSFDAAMQSQVVVRGTVDDRDDGDVGWDVELAIPLAAVKGKDPAMKVNLPPVPGDTWRLNVVRGDKNREGKVTASSWKRLSCEDWHGLDRMVTVQFADAAGSIVPVGLAPVEPAPAGLVPVEPAPVVPVEPTAKP